MEQGQLDDEGLLDALQDGEKEEDAVEGREEDLEQSNYSKTTSRVCSQMTSQEE